MDPENIRLAEMLHEINGLFLYHTLPSSDPFATAEHMSEPEKVFRGIFLFQSNDL